MGLATRRLLAPATEGTRVGRQLAAGTAVLLVVRLLLTIPRPGPVVLIDEIGYLTNARVLGGGLAAELLTSPFYRGGYSLLLAPVTALFDDPETAYRVILVVNCVLAAALFTLLYALLASCFRVPPRLAVWPAFAAAAYPSVTTTTGAAMSENLLLPLTVVWLIAFGRMLLTGGDGVRAGWAVVFGVCAAGLWATHGRMVVAAVLSAGVLIYLLVRRRLAMGVVGAGLGALGVGLAFADEHPDSRPVWKDPVRDQLLWGLSGPGSRAAPARQP